MLDCSVVSVPDLDSVLISSHDFFYPLIDDPYLMGAIGAANVLSDLYAFGVIQPNSMLMTLASSTQLNIDERRIVSLELMRGFRDLARSAGCFVTGGQTVLNPWPIIGGIASGIVHNSKRFYTTRAVPGDVLVLTKPLGTQVIANAYEWLRTTQQALVDLQTNDIQSVDLNQPISIDLIRCFGADYEKKCALKWNSILENTDLSVNDVCQLLDESVFSMTRLNRNASELMIQLGAHACTDVTGFGILGHAEKLALTQENEVSFVIRCLPLLSKVEQIDRASKDGEMFGLLKGRSAETSGGLLIALDPKVVDEFLARIMEIDGCEAFVIGNVCALERNGKRGAVLLENPEIIESMNPAL
uniref:Selenide, water dikinase n=1 Tax=Timspurckia oligopyrenoides TaxID=708627 RepID=A0A7S0ZKH3_9RHOD|mmetsp:Transcript_8730/g.15761  ORF Transcript_8730/g.15761 Transcript_8730/m.15761 type:complete len:358 (+) Transcript_8730:325-1398(+)|eukprot:CAMPEP_0182441550 /NCGR_PEP_ID=MMETSP1172-20130603/527_1 /TAXON_ID=708627 /ORGANISM="Timspurckia oligopyrenoides, Strain CCMP3278" /LENGTH=357 /DNA_ID=CAMNT_0024635905 /DNA_START=261 /DNA_END=1334 /DNA_ORIENTATION=+